MSGVVARGASLLAGRFITLSHPSRWTSRQRVGGLIALSAVLLAAIMAVLAIFLTGTEATLETNRADEHDAQAVELLVTVGSNMPELNRSALESGLAGADRAEPDHAVERGRHDGILSSLTLWNVQGRAVYGDGPVGRLGGIESSALRRALHGSEATVANPGSMDFNSGKRSGTLDSFEPLRDDGGRTFGVAEVSRPLQPVAAAAAAGRGRIELALAIGALLVWLVLLPAIVRAAIAVSQASPPGRRQLRRDFRRAVLGHEIELRYQPQIDPSHGGLRAVEALVRWRRGGRLLTPETFLPEIEGTKLMTRLTDRVVELALAQLAAWRRAGDWAPRMSVNLSAGDLSDEGLPARIAAALRRHEVPGDQLTVEVTETAILEDRECARRVLDAIAGLGVDIAVDDFGTGHASISRLHDLPISEVKIDRSFVGLADQHERDYLTAIVHFCQSLGLRIVAEGVEDAETLVYLRRLGCDLVQGYHIARPLPGDAIPLWRTQGVLLGKPFTAAA